jgi:hypothetical protein
MEITQAQKDVRQTFLGGFAGQLASSLLWAISAAAATWHSLRLGGLILVLGGFFIFPTTQLLLRAMGHAYALPKGHPMNALAVQIAFTLPLTMLVVLALASLHPAFFYPAMMIALGAHYLPFVFLYGMRMFAVLCGLLVTGGVLIALHLPNPVSAGAWITAAILLAFSLAGFATVRTEQKA